MKLFKFAFCLLVLSLSLSIPVFADLITTVAGGGTMSPSIGMPATDMDLGESYSAKVDKDGYLYIPNYSPSTNPALWVRRVNPWGEVDKLYGDPAIQVNYFDDLCVDGEGSVYLPAYNEDLVYKVEPGGAISVYAGNGTPGTTGDGGPATMAQIDTPESLAIDLDGNLYIAHHASSQPIIRKVSRDGIISTLFDGTSFGMNRVDTLYVGGSGNVYFFDYNNYKVWKVNPQGVASLVAGTGMSGHSGEGVPGDQAQIRSVGGIAGDDWGNIYLTYQNGSDDIIRKIDPFGIITTIATMQEVGYSSRMSVDRDGMLFVTWYDYSNGSVVRKVAFTPGIHEFMPVTAGIGEQVSIQGRYFTSKATGGSVTFGGVAAEIVSWGNDTIVCTIPQGASTGDVVVTTPDGQQSIGINFKMK